MNVPFARFYLILVVEQLCLGRVRPLSLTVLLECMCRTEGGKKVVMCVVG